MKHTIKGTLCEIGNDETGTPRIVIATEKTKLITIYMQQEEVASFWGSLYKNVKITIETEKAGKK